MYKLLAIISISFFTLTASFNYDVFMKMQENTHDIPAFLLRAISNNESGKKVGDSIVPWPWTINVEGKGYTFQTKQEAIRAVEKFQHMGAKSIDVGIMQINLRHHPTAFKSLDEAFDPQANIAYGAKFLKQLFEQHKDWQSAVGHYHSATPKFHNAYKQKVLSNWFQLINNKQGEIPLQKAVMQFDKIEGATKKQLSGVGVIKKAAGARKKVNPYDIGSFAKARKVYYALEGVVPAHSASSHNVSYTLENSSREYYSLD